MSEDIECHTLIGDLIKLRLGDDKDMHRKYAKEYISGLYGEENINIDVVDVYLDVMEGVYVLVYDNLYTFVLLCGVNVPYCDWIYEQRYESQKYIYLYDAGTCKRLTKKVKQMTKDATNDEEFKDFYKKLVSGYTAKTRKKT